MKRGTGELYHFPKIAGRQPEIPKFQEISFKEVVTRCMHCRMMHMCEGAKQQEGVIMNIFYFRTFLCIHH